jgi:prevent-host-death family protein
MVYIHYCMNNFVVSSRDIQRRYKDIVERVKHTKHPALVVSQNEPQVAIVSLEDYEELRRIQMRKGFEELQKLAHQISEEHTDNPLPSDMSVNHDTYLAEALEKDLKRIHR